MRPARPKVAGEEWHAYENFHSGFVSSLLVIINENSKEDLGSVYVSKEYKIWNSRVELTHHGQVAEKPRDLRELIKIFLQESKNCAKLVFSQEIMHLIPIVLSSTI